MPPGQVAPQPSEWRQHGPVLIACVAGVTLATVVNYSIGVMMGPLEDEFGWSRAEISSGPLILAVMAVFVTPLVGIAIDRLGPRRIGLFGVSFFCCALALLATAGPAISSWLLLWVPLSLASIFILPLLWVAAINSLFVKNRGFALAIALCGTGLGGTTIPLLTHILVTHFGWRGGYIGLALLSAAVVLPLTWFFLTSAKDTRRTSYSAEQKAVPVPAITGTTARAGLRSWRFVKLITASTAVSFGAGAIITNAVPILVSDGFSRAEAASIAGLIGIGAIVGRLSGGYLIDRVNPNIVAGTCVLMPAIACVLLLAAPGSTAGAIAAFLVLGLGVGTEVDAVAFLTARHFGLRSFGTIYGTINGLIILANMGAPVLANHVYDIVKSYTPFLWILIPVFSVGATLFFVLGEPSALEEADDSTVPPPAGISTPHHPQNYGSQETS